VLGDPRKSGTHSAPPHEKCRGISVTSDQAPINIREHTPAPSEPPAASVAMPNGARGSVVPASALKRARHEATMAGRAQP
jgi:hypothetical protein